ncbi:DegV family protein [Chloroflexota bacterium]
MVKVVTDSTSDIPAEIARDLGINIVPCYVRFGKEVFRDGVDLHNEEFYKKLIISDIHPNTAQPSPGDFVDVYNKLAESTDSIVSIHISSKLSGVYNSALQAKKLVVSKCQIEVVDSLFNSAGLGLITITAAKLANSGANLHTVMAEVKRSISEVKMLGIFDTLKYMIRGGRITKLKGTIASVIGVKPMLTFRDGEIIQSGLARTYSKGMDKLVTFVKDNMPVASISISHSDFKEGALDLKERLTGIFLGETIFISELGPALGVHGGPGVLLVAIRRSKVS